jgi:hypothetical protein
MERVPIAEFSISSELLIAGVEFDGPTCLVHTNFLRLNEEFGRHHLTDIYVARRQTIPEICLHRVPAGVNLAVHGDQDFILYLGDRVLAEQIRPYWTDDDVAAVVAGATGLAEVPEEVLLIARYGVRTWGHWLGELLPKVVCVERAYPGRFRYVVPESIVADLNLGTVRQSLEAYGVGQERLLLVRGGRGYRFANLFAVSPVWFPLCPFHPHVVSLMRAIIPPSDQIVGLPKSVALLRRESATRKLANIGEVSAYLQSRRWLIVDVARLDFLYQVKIFARAEHIVSVLGSGLTGLIYSPEGVRVVTLAPSNWGDLFFFSLMQERLARLADIRGLSLAAEASDAALLPFVVAVEDLENGLRALDLAVEPESPVPRSLPGANPQ